MKYSRHWFSLALSVVTLMPCQVRAASALTSENVQSTPIPQPVAPQFSIPFPTYNESDTWLYKPGEFFLEGYGIGALFNGNKISDTIGAGGGLGYYFTRHFAVVAEGFNADLPGGHHATVLGGLQFRLPVDDLAMAFYGFVEGGAFLGDHDGGTFQAGLGIDLRLTQHASLFFDLRGITIANQHVGDGLPTTTRGLKEADGAALLRLGLRFVF